MSKELAKSARKRFGQNFLIDGRIIDAILASINASASDAVVEIGPGHGAITEGLYASQCDLTLIELDRDLVPGLLASFVSKSPERCRLLNEDVLKVDFTELGGPLRIVGNLPYNISTPLLFKLLELGNQIQDIHVMLQKEVVNRIAAAGRLGVMIQATAHVEPLIDVPPESFAPPPKVDSGVIRIIPDANKRALIESTDALTQVVRQAFSQRRKTLRNNLKDVVSLDEFEALGINPQDRPERLSVETYVELGNYLGRREGKA
ncbi:MAG: 16S rRNA (adenine(1518)-N(6)/adenine(1519)-N(6))-dimethyltransferase RsmA [Gammaproteobacteria bacterium]|nr:16S rRNA (adenine(1518)-N(6)/adenine(1519)-N(6))-dimethyltransferase RsmA [Gammaproteobacteria bacterium]